MDGIVVSDFNVEELAQALSEAPDLAFRYLNQEVGRAGNRVRKRFVASRLSGPPGIRGGEWRRQKNRHVKVLTRGSSLETLRCRIQLSRFLSLHETGGTLTAHRKGARALRLPIGPRRGVEFRGSRFAREADGHIKGLVYIPRPGKSPILAEKVNGRLVPKFVLVKSVKIPARLEFRATVQAAWPEQYPRLHAALHRAMTQAMQAKMRTLTGAVQAVLGAAA